MEDFEKEVKDIDRSKFTIVLPTYVQNSLLKCKSKNEEISYLLNYFYMHNQNRTIGELHDIIKGRYRHTEFTPVQMMEDGVVYQCTLTDLEYRFTSVVFEHFDYHNGGWRPATLVRDMFGEVFYKANEYQVGNKPLG